MRIKSVLLSIKNFFSLRLHSINKYVIVDYVESSNINTSDVYLLVYGNRAVFKKNIVDIAFEGMGIISGLLPEQACFLGIKVGECIKNDVFSDVSKNKNLSKKEFLNKYNSVSFDKFGNVIYLDHDDEVDKLKSINLVVAAKSENIINKFDPITAYSIGIQIGRNISKYVNHKMKQEEESTTNDVNVLSFSRNKTL